MQAPFDDVPATDVVLMKEVDDGLPVGTLDGR
jgi:hypothetical protein